MKKFRVFAETAPTAIIVYQGEGIVYVNSAATRLFGYSEEELLKMNFWEWAVAEDRQFVRERGMARQRGEHPPGCYELRFLNSEGTTGWVTVSAGAIEYRGQPAGIAMFSNISEAKRTEERLQASLAEKEVLLKEVHHRVKNNLQIISSLLYLQSEAIPDERSRAYLRESQNRVRSMSLIHERLYGTKNFSSIDFGEYIRELSQFLFNSYAVDSGRINLNVNGAGGVLEINEAILCGLIVNELLSNSLKHAFTGDQAGEISIHMGRNTDGWINLTVADTGIGLPPGLDYRNTETLGLQLVNTLVRQLRGRLLVGDEGPGTLVSIAFPGSAQASGGGAGLPE